VPNRPAKVTGPETLHVLNQSIIEIQARIDQAQRSIPLHKSLKTSASLNFGAISANSTVERSANIPGVTQSATVHASPQLSLGNSNLIWSAYVRSSGVATIRLLNPTGSPVTPNTVTWNIAILQ
jgi:hypothetical protein